MLKRPILLKMSPVLLLMTLPPIGPPKSWPIKVMSWRMMRIKCELYSLFCCRLVINYEYEIITESYKNLIKGKTILFQITVVTECSFLWFTRKFKFEFIGTSLQPNLRTFVYILTNVIFVNLVINRYLKYNTRILKLCINVLCSNGRGLFTSVKM